MLDNIIFNEAMYNYGREKALELREAASELTDTEIIDQELFIPHWKEGPQTKDAPLQYEGQVYRVLQAHDSTGNPSWTPATQPALFSICHTKNPYKAKPWIAPQGISGMYELGDCYIDDEGIIWRQIYNDSNVYDAATLPERWEEVDLNNFQETENTGVIEEPEIPVEPEEPEEPEESEEWIEWVQPTGSHDAYPLGAKVTHNDKYWINTGKENNEYEPGIWGWDEIVE